MIATQWTPVETIKKLTDENSYALMGQLYTKKGINYVIRNILANPFITRIYLVGSDLMESGEAFKKFMKEGVDENGLIIGDDVAKIEKEISAEALEAFRKNVEIVDLMGADKLPKLKELIKAEESKGTWRDPETFSDPPKPQVSVYPGEIDLIRIKRQTVSEAYVSTLKHIMQFGLESKPVINYVSDTSSKMHELLNLSIVVESEDPSSWVVPEYMPFSKTDLDSYFKGFFNPDRGTEDYSYGERLFNYAGDEMERLCEIYPWLKIDRFKKYFPHGGIDQVAVSIVRKLKSFEFDKGAIALLGNPFTDVFPQRPPKKIPCLFLIQCQIYQGMLSMTAYFRSNDMYNAWPLNAFALRKLQSEIAKQLEVEMGALVTISNMAHIYEHNYSDAEKIVKDNFTPGCEWDPRGNFQIELQGDEIVVRLMTPRGNEELKEWRIDGKSHKAAHELCYQIIDRDLAVSVLGNAADLARQLERAETAVKLGLKYNQDNPLDFSTTQKHGV